MASGTLTHVGPMSMSTGGAVPNVGLALNRLGVPVRLAGWIGDDPLGRTLGEIIDCEAPGAGRHLVVRPGDATSYSVVIARPGCDRAFWHCPGVNDLFDPDSISDAVLRGAGWLHFGYPPIMKRVCDAPESLARLFARARALGLRTSLDLCSIDPASHAGDIDWVAWLGVVLPHVDLFTPSFDETAFALRSLAGPFGGTPSLSAVRKIAEVCRTLGAAAVLVKLGEHGLYFIDNAGEARAPCFDVAVASATGAGDCTIAGMIAGRHTGLSIGESVELAVATGGASCEQADAISGVTDYQSLASRIAGGWRRLPDRLI